MSSHLGLLQIRLKHMLTQGVAEQGYAGSSFRNHNTANSSQLTTNLDNLNRMVVAEPLEAQVVFCIFAEFIKRAFDHAKNLCHYDHRSFDDFLPTKHADCNALAHVLESHLKLELLVSFNYLVSVRPNRLSW